MVGYETTLKDLSEETGLSVSQVRKGIRKLSESGFLASKTTNKNTLLRLENIGLSEGSVFTFDKQNDKQNYYLSVSNDAAWIEQVTMMYSSTESKIKTKLKDFNAFLIAVDDKKKSMSDYKRHFMNWLKVNSKDLREVKVHSWKWKGQSAKTGTYEQMIKDKKAFDQPGFDFKLISNGN